MVNQIEENLRAIQTSIAILNMVKTNENKEVLCKIAALKIEEYLILKELGIK